MSDTRNDNHQQSGELNSRLIEIINAEHLEYNRWIAAIYSEQNLIMQIVPLLQHFVWL